MSSKASSYDFLLCVACRMLLKEPVTLPCGHTFCRQCVITSNNDGAQSDKRDTPTGSVSIGCPLCKVQTEVPEAEDAGKDWRTKRQKNAFVQKLVDSGNSKESGGKFCTLCKDEGVTKAPVIWCSYCDCYLCAECQKVHKKLNSSHGVTDVTPENAASLPKTSRCDKHEECVLDLLCNDCDEAVCQRCCILNHRSCKTVKPLQEARNRIDTVLKEWSGNLEKHLPELQKRVSSLASTQNRFAKMFSDTECAIDAVSNDLVDEIRFQQGQLKTKLGLIEHEITENLAEDTKSCEMSLAEARQRIGFAEEAVLSSTLMDHFDVYKMFASIRKTEKPSCKVKDIEKNPLYKKDIKFVSNKDTLLKALVKRRIGHLRGETESIDKEDKKAVIDIGVPNFHDMTMLTVEGKAIFLVTSPDLKVIQWFSIKSDKTETGDIRLDSPAFAIAKLEAKKAVTTLPRKKQILVLSLQDDKIDRESIIKTQLRYIGLASLSTTILAATGEDTGFVDIIDLTGARLRSFGADILVKPVFVYGTSEGNVLVSDWKKRQVICFTDEGEIIFRYEPKDENILRYPCGLAEAANGDIYVVDRAQHKILQLSEKGNFIGDAYDFLDGVSDPCAVFINDNNDIYFSVDNRYIRWLHIDG